MTTLTDKQRDLVRFALLRADIELACFDDPDICGNVLGRRFVRASTLETVRAALQALDAAQYGERYAATV